MGVVVLKVKTKDWNRESWHGEDEGKVVQEEKIERMADRRLTLAIVLECRTHAVVHIWASQSDAKKKKKKKQFGAKMGSLKCFIVNLKKNVWKDVSIIALP